MRYFKFLAGAALSLAVGAVYADDVEQPPRTHVDTTVVGDSTVGNPNPPAANLDSDHRFVPGAPTIVSATKRLNLSPKQVSQVHEAIESADAGAADLIKHEQNVEQMLAATTPEDPMYAKLIKDQTTDVTLWDENRENLKQSVEAILTPAQRSRFEELTAKR
jgi:Spy/CpxP family protein refolding chaperone